MLCITTVDNNQSTVALGRWYMYLYFSVLVQPNACLVYGEARGRTRCVSLRMYSYSNRGPITKGDNRVHGWVKVHGWKACTKPMEVVPKKFKYKQKKDNRGSTIEGVYTRVCCAVF